MGLFDSMGFGLGLQATPKDYINVYLTKDKQAAEEARKNSKAYQEVSKAIGGVDQSGIHRLLQNKAKEAYANAVLDIKDQKAQSPNNYVGYAYERIGQLKNELNDLRSRSQKLVELGKADPLTLTYPAQQAQKIVNTGKDISELSAVKDSLGTYSTAENGDPTWSALSDVNIGDEVKKRLNDESNLVNLKITNMGDFGGKGNDYALRMVQSAPETDAEAASISKELGFQVKSKPQILGDLWDTSPKIRALYQENNRGNILDETGTSKIGDISSPSVNKFLKDRFISEYAPTGGRKMSYSMQSYPQEQNKWGGYGENIGVQHGGSGTFGTSEKRGSGTIEGNTTTFSDSYGFNTVSVQMPADFAWDGDKGRRVSIGGNIPINVSQVAKIKYIVAKQDIGSWDPTTRTFKTVGAGDKSQIIRKGDKIPVSDERARAIIEKYPGTEVKEGWFANANAEGGTYKGEKLSKNTLIPMTKDRAQIINAALQKSAGKNEIPLLDPEEFGENDNSAEEGQESAPAAAPSPSTAPKKTKAEVPEYSLDEFKKLDKRYTNDMYESAIKAGKIKRKGK